LRFEALPCWCSINVGKSPIFGTVRTRAKREAAKLRGNKSHAGRLVDAAEVPQTSRKRCAAEDFSLAPDADIRPSRSR
jgi:hypothetical protein